MILAQEHRYRRKGHTQRRWGVKIRSMGGPETNTSCKALHNKRKETKKSRIDDISAGFYCSVYCLLLFVMPCTRFVIP